MKKLTFVTMAFLMALGVFGLQAGPALAGEHGGSTMKTDSGSVLKGTKDDAATLKEAAAVLKSSNPDLAQKLEKMAQAQCGI